MYGPPEQHELLAKGQPMPAQGYNCPQPMPVQGYNNPQLVAGGQPGFHQPPTQVQVMPRPAAIPGVPPGLELLEALVGWESHNKYQIKNTLGQQVYFAVEESGCCTRQFCGSHRGFIMHITDNLGQEIIRVTRDFKCCAGCGCCACSDCCAYEIQIEAPVGQVVGYAKQLHTCTRPRFSVMDAGQQEVLYIEGPLCVCQGICCTWDQQFRIMPSDRSQVIGKITKQWSGLVKELMTDADNFSVSFPMDLDVRVKAALLGTVFLIDFMYFEQKNQKQN